MTVPRKFLFVVLGFVAPLGCAAAEGLDRRITLFQNRYFEVASGSGFQHESQVTTSCETLPERYDGNVSSIQTSICVLLFANSSCEGMHYQVEGLQPRLCYMENETRSFRSCLDIQDEMEFRDNRLKLYGRTNYQQLLLDLPLNTKCVNLPQWAVSRVSSVRTDVCIDFFTSKNCNGAQFTVNLQHMSDLMGFNGRATSFRVCNEDDMLKKPRLAVHILSFEVTADPDGNSREEHLDMGANQLFSNNGSATIVQTYEVERNVMEVVEIERFVGTSTFHHFDVDLEVNATFGLDLPIDFLKAKVDGSLRAGYAFQKNVSEECRELYRNETGKRFRVQQEVHVPACRYYEINSTVQMRTGYPLLYLATALVTGDLVGKPMSAGEIKAILPPEMVYIDSPDNVTVLVQFENKMTVDFGLYTETYATGGKLIECEVIVGVEGDGDATEDDDDDEVDYLRFINLNI